MLAIYKRIFYLLQRHIGMAGGATLMVLLPVYPAAALLILLPTQETLTAVGFNTTDITLYGLLFLVLYLLLSVSIHNRLFARRLLDPQALASYRPAASDYLMAGLWVLGCLGIFAYALMGN
ncbi:MAG: hypothetical protein ACFCUI_07880 [Bernardetiaceae bacterium]